MSEKTTLDEMTLESGKYEAVTSGPDCRHCDLRGTEECWNHPSWCSAQLRSDGRTVNWKKVAEEEQK